MIVRVLIYSHVVAIALTGWAAYCDRHHGLDGIVGMGIIMGGPAALLIPVFPLLTLGILLARRVTDRDKLFAILVEIPATFAHLVAGMPLVQ